MDPFSYICILTSIVAGLAVTRIVGGLGQLLQTRRRTPTYWVHTLWMLNTLLAIIVTWWLQYRWRHAENWTLFLFLWLLVTPILLYLAAALLFPNEQEGERITNWRNHFYAAKRGYFILLSVTVAVDVFDTLLKGLSYFASFGAAYPIRIGILLALSLVGAFIRSARYQAAFAVFFLVYNLAMLGSNLLRLM